MTILWGWIQGTAGDIPTYPARDDRLVLQALHDEGVVRGCKATAGDPARTVIIGTGQFAVTGDDQANQGLYIGTVTVAETVAIGAAPGSGTRIDLVCFKVQDLAAGGPAGNDIVPLVVVGTVGAGQPALPASAIPVCAVSMTAGQNSVTAAQVTDLRVMAETKSAVGSIKLWYGPSTRIPSGWRCLTIVGNETIGAFGSFPDLADLLGVTSGNIVVANVRGRSPIGIDTADATIDTLGELAGAATVTLASGNLPSHTHGLANHSHSASTGTESSAHNHGVSLTTSSDGSHAHTLGGGGNNFVGFAGAAASGLAVAAGGTQYASTDAAAAHSHTASTTSGAESALHSHAVTVGTPSPNTSDAAGSGTAFSVRPPVVALHVLLRVS